MTAAQWSIPRESKEWVGPIVVTATVNGTAVAIDPSLIRFALIPLRDRPAEADWTEPVRAPGDDGAIGVQADPVAEEGRFGIWVRFTDAAEIPVLDPSSVGTLLRT